MRPQPRLTISRCAAREHRNAPLRCTAATESQSSSVILWIRLSRMIPALLTRISSEPSRRTISSTILSTSAATVILALIPIALTPCRAAIRAAVASAPSPFRSATAIAAPSSASRSAVASPMPRAPPVTSATRASERLAMFLPLLNDNCRSLSHRQHRRNPVWPGSSKMPGDDTGEKQPPDYPVRAEFTEAIGCVIGIDPCRLPRQLERRCSERAPEPHPEPRGGPGQPPKQRRHGIEREQEWPRPASQGQRRGFDPDPGIVLLVLVRVDCVVTEGPEHAAEIQQHRRPSERSRYRGPADQG